MLMPMPVPVPPGHDRARRPRVGQHTWGGHRAPGSGAGARPCGSSAPCAAAALPGASPSPARPGGCGVPPPWALPGRGLARCGRGNAAPERSPDAQSAGAPFRQPRCAGWPRRCGCAVTSGTHLGQMCTHPDVRARQGMLTPGRAISQMCTPARNQPLPCIQMCTPA